MSEWYEIDAAWDVNEYASDKLLKLGETEEWGDLVNEAAMLTHATAEEIWDGMAKALRGYLESLDGLTVFTPNDAHAEPRTLKDVLMDMVTDVAHQGHQIGLTAQEIVERYEREIREVV